jgi:hypothetical protein
MRVAGAGQHIESHDTYASSAVAICCSKIVGTLRARVSTVFGLVEDQRVLGGPWKVY